MRIEVKEVEERGHGEGRIDAIADRLEIVQLTEESPCGAALGLIVTLESPPLGELSIGVIVPDRATADAMIAAMAHYRDNLWPITEE